VLACAADRLAMLPGTRIGLSGPKVLESVHGKWELDADDDRDVEAVFGAKARSAMGFVDLLADDGDALRGWVYRTVRDRPDFATSVGATHALLRTRIAGDPAHTTPFATLACFDGAAPVDNGGRLWVRDECWLTRPHPGSTVGADVHALDVRCSSTSPWRARRAQRAAAGRGFGAMSSRVRPRCASSRSSSRITRRCSACCARRDAG
jgi:hypothetical protein